jgi:RsiW-degrading membrane proteinase PrsW (M82 family)
MHVFNGVIMGCFFAFYKHSKDIKFLGYSILIPIILHGSYNFLLGVDFLHIEKIIVIIMIFLSYKLFNILERLDSKYK